MRRAVVLVFVLTLLAGCGSTADTTTSWALDVETMDELCEVFDDAEGEAGESTGIDTKEQAFDMLALTFGYTQRRNSTTRGCIAGGSSTGIGSRVPRMRATVHRSPSAR
jgi:hypothetical protein